MLSRRQLSVRTAAREEPIVFAYQIWKPKFLSVVQSPFDNYHLPLYPATLFEIGVCHLQSQVITICAILANVSTLVALCEAGL